MGAQTDSETGLSDQHRVFADEYLVDFVAGAAYERAGYKARGRARDAAASRLLAKPQVQAYLATRKAALVSKSTLTLERLTKEIEAICFADPRKLFEENGALKNLNTLDDDIARSVSGIELGDKVKVTMWDKLGAIEKAFKLLNAYPDRKQDMPKETIVGVVILPAKGTYEHPEKRAIEGRSQRMERLPSDTPKGKAFKVRSSD